MKIYPSAILSVALLFIALNSSAQGAAPSPADGADPAENVNPFDTTYWDGFLLDFDNFEWNDGKPTPKTDSVATEKKSEAGTSSSNSYNIDFSNLDFYMGKGSAETIKTVTIGIQTWTAANLDVSTFRNGDPIPEAKTNEEWMSAGSSKKPAWCYFNNETAKGAEYGKLYNWWAVTDPRGLAPEGWHIPTEEEWESLTYNAGGINAGQRLKSVTGWKESNSMGTNETGFTALPGGRRNKEGVFYKNENANGFWWTTTPFVTGSTGYGFDMCYYCNPGKNIYNGEGLSVRCVKD